MRIGNPQYIFRHALVRDASYESFDPKEREAIHLWIAIVLERDFTEVARSQPEVLAEHWGMAGEYEKAAEYGLEAARGAISRSLYKEAINHARNAVAWARQIEEKLTRIEKEFSRTRSSCPL